MALSSKACSLNQRPQWKRLKCGWLLLNTLKCFASYPCRNCGEIPANGPSLWPYKCLSNRIFPRIMQSLTKHNFRCIARLLLIYQHNETIIETPTITPLNRGRVAKCQTGGSKHLLGLGQSEFDSDVFTLKRSGRVVRKVESSPPIGNSCYTFIYMIWNSHFELGLRNWKPVEHQAPKFPIDLEISKCQLIAETLYVAKPLIHLASMGVFGKTTWKPWVISLAVDLTR